MTAGVRTFRAMLLMPLIPGIGSAGTSLTDPSVPAWSFDGHRVVCEIAWREMDGEARGEARRLTAAYGQFNTFSQSCVWADSPDARAVHNSHWVNLPPGSPRVSMDDCPEDCVLRHLDAELSILTDARLDDDARARALMFVSHFMGDLHQPAHVAYELDRGGNGHEIVGLTGGIDDLHGVWDRYMIQDRARDWMAYGAALQDDVNPVDRTLWLPGQPLDWATETFRIAEDYLYDGLEGPSASRLSDGYVERHRQTTERQLKKAGVRLGGMLQQALTSP